MLPLEVLPQILPGDPMPMFASWLADAKQRASQPNPDSMVLASVDNRGRPSARVVLCKRVNVDAGYIVFFTNYFSRKGRELQAQPYASVVFHWDALHRQVRIEGQVTRSPESESDEYFVSRALDSRVGAWASEQSAPLESRDLLAERVRAVADKFAIQPGTTDAHVPRPPHWGGFRLWAEAIEFWAEGANRVHDRAVWKRTLTRGVEGFQGGSWSATRLYP